MPDALSGECVRPPPCLGDAIGATRSGAPALLIFVVVPADLAPDAAAAWVGSARVSGAVGIVVDGGLRGEGARRGYGPDSRVPARSLVGLLRELWPGGDLTASGGIHRPIDALLLLGAGADFVRVDSGLVDSGPSLPKRINEAVLARRHGGMAERVRRPAAKMTRFRSMPMALGMLLGSLMALAIASTRVVLPHDEQFAGLGRPEIAAISPRLLDSIAHDRVTLAGVMPTLGVLHGGLSLFGIRRGMQRAIVAVVSSASAGFASFFLFPGFGYLDPLHAFVSVRLLQFMVVAVHADPGRRRTRDAGPVNDRAWRLSQ